MTTLDVNTPVSQFITERPSTAEVFERYGIDYCCGGTHPLAMACRHRGFDPEIVLDELTVSAIREPSAQQPDWLAASMSELVDHIESTHHAYLRKELPRLAALTRKIAIAFGDHDPALRQLEDVFEQFRYDLESHVEREEWFLFPLIRELDSASTLPEFSCGCISSPTRAMVQDHEEVEAALVKMRMLTDGFQAPPGACHTFREMLEGLAVLEKDLHVHLHKENNILFPRANRAEARLLARRLA